MGRKLEDLVGRKFGKLFVLEYVGKTQKVPVLSALLETIFSFPQSHTHFHEEINCF